MSRPRVERDRRFGQITMAERPECLGWRETIPRIDHGVPLVVCIFKAYGGSEIAFVDGWVGTECAFTVVRGTAGDAG